MSDPLRKAWDGIEQSILPGALYVVATPIGNLADITLRALYILDRVDVVVAEDTRHTKRLMERYGISTPMRAYHEHNAQKVLPGLIEELKGGRTLAQVSDAGTPGVSDPGFKLIREAVAQGVEVVPVPGASALLAAVIGSGLPLDRFVFEGFLPKKKGRETRLRELAEDPRTLVFFESPQRLGRTLEDLAQALGGQRLACVGRELTKSHEELVRGTLSELAQKYRDQPPKGEIALVVEGRGKRVVREEKKGDDAAGTLPGLRFPDMGGQY